MRVCHITQDYGLGGAGAAMMHLHRALGELGVDSTVWTARRHVDDVGVRIIDQPGLLNRITSRMGRDWQRRINDDHQSRQRATIFSVPPRSRRRMWRHITEPYDVVVFNWVAQMMTPADIAAIARRRTVVWRLTDLNPITGGCHSSMSCDRFTQHCHECPMVGDPANRRKIASIHAGKMASFSAIDRRRLTFIAQSRWMQNCIGRTSAASGFPIRVIRNGVDRARFHPAIRPDRRDAPVTFGVFASAGDVRRSTDALIRQWVGRVRDDVDSHRPMPSLRIYGTTAQDINVRGNHSKRSTKSNITLHPSVDASAMPEVLSELDGVLFPHRQDNCPNLVLESQAVGTPVIAMSNSGVAELIRSGVNGISIDDGDFNGMCEAAMRFNPSDFDADTVAQTVADIRDVAAKYAEVYRDASDAFRGSGG